MKVEKRKEKEEIEMIETEIEIETEIDEIVIGKGIVDEIVPHTLAGVMTSLHTVGTRGPAQEHLGEMIGKMMMILVNP